MANKTECQTKDVVYITKIRPKKITVKLKLPNDLNLSKKEAKILDKNIHNALELVLSKYYYK